MTKTAKIIVGAVVGGAVLYFVTRTRTSTSAVGAMTAAGTAVEGSGSVGASATSATKSGVRASVVASTDPYPYGAFSKIASGGTQVAKDLYASASRLVVGFASPPKSSPGRGV